MSGSGFVGVHMGAGYHSPINWVCYNEVCKSACLKATEVLKAKNNALEAAVAALVYLENSRWSNAGFGSNLSLTGTVECDASIMDGKSLQYGAVGAVSGVKNPVKLAENILMTQMKGDMTLGRVPPCLLVGEGAHRWAVKHGLEIVKNEDLITESSRRLFIKNKRKLEMLGECSDDECQLVKIPRFQAENELQPSNDNEVVETDSGGSTLDGRMDTIGVVCVDGEGRVVSAVSSGGILLKQPGRIGQAAMYGCGCWAENDSQTNVGVATTTSGCGEHLVKTLLAKECAETLKSCEDPVESLVSCFNTKFIGSPFLRQIAEPMGGVLGLKVTRRSPQNLIVDFDWAHTTDSMSLGFMSTLDSQPEAMVSKLPVGHEPGKSIVAGCHTCKIAAEEKI